ncbi:hypothetical protein BLNAU_12015 [Blattamonas nauphoetae]|uniref:Uncharacterized protein n=1 Tax=Blattamonas nauphoetae TaxID=2049346 RepID=A0ABQ9XLV3_9EUKA|nr:hypothetical protein BLNAU_12015 [Blattamonas nauphoetae]
MISPSLFDDMTISDKTTVAHLSNGLDSLILLFEQNPKLSALQARKAIKLLQKISSLSSHQLLSELYPRRAEQKSSIFSSLRTLLASNEPEIVIEVLHIVERMCNRNKPEHRVLLLKSRIFKDLLPRLISSTDTQLPAHIHRSIFTIMESMMWFGTAHDISKTELKQAIRKEWILTELSETILEPAEIYLTYFRQHLRVILNKDTRAAHLYLLLSILKLAAMDSKIFSLFERTGSKFVIMTLLLETDSTHLNLQNIEQLHKFLRSRPEMAEEQETNRTRVTRQLISEGLNDCTEMQRFWEIKSGLRGKRFRYFGNQILIDGGSNSSIGDDEMF